MDTNIDKSHCFSNIDKIRYCRLIAEENDLFFSIKDIEIVNYFD